MNFYWMLQFSLILGFLGAALMHFVWNFSNRSSSCKQLKKLNQFLFLGALLLPLLVPSRIVSKFPLPEGMRKPLAESTETLTEAAKGLLAVRPVEEGELITKSDNLILVESSHFLFLLMCLGFFLGVYRLFKSLKTLNHLLRSVYLLKTYGGLRLAVSEEISIPFSLWYFGQRWVLFPTSILKSRSVFKVSLKHELEHHRSHDTVWAFFLEFANPLFYFNPAFYLWKNTILDLQEFSCDESLIGRKKLHPGKYGDCLIQVAETALRNRLTLKGVAAMANQNQTKTSLERRIRMFTSYKKNRPQSLFLGILALILILGITVSNISLRAFTTPSLDNPTLGVASVDPKVQKIAEKYLFEAFSKFHATAGFALVSEVSTGKVLAVANINSEPAAPHLPHWALSLRVEPASLMKAIVAAAAIEKGATDPNEVHNCENGKLIVENKEYSDWKPFSKLTTAETVAHSSNICGIKVAMKLGAENIREALKTFGFSDPVVTSSFPEARPGVLPEIDGLGKEQYVARASSGFGFYITPLEMVQAFGVIANGGNLFKPIQVNEKVVQPLRRVLSEETAKKMRSILGLVMTEGTASKAQGKKHNLAGKTGTGYSPWLVERNVAKDSQIAHFVGFGPLEAPKYVVYVGIQDPKNEKDHRAHGAAHAAPVFRDILEALL